MNRFESVPTTILGTGYLNEPHMSVVSVQRLLVFCRRRHGPDEPRPRAL